MLGYKLGMSANTLSMMVNSPAMTANNSVTMENNLVRTNNAYFQGVAETTVNMLD